MGKVDRTVAGYTLGNLKPGPLPEVARLARTAAAEGAVLLKNNKQVLPFQKGQIVSVFGRIQFHYYKSGTGSGGMVNVEYVTNIPDSLRKKDGIRLNEKLAALYKAWVAEHPFEKGEGWAKEPWSQEEMPLDEQTVAQAAAESDVALVIIGRTAGEDKDNFDGPGSLRVTDTELDMLKKVRKYFEKVCVVLNTGNIMHTPWVQELDIDALLYVWQGGFEGGNAAADLLCGDATPSGKLSDTIACSMDVYPAHSNFGSKVENFYQEDIYVGYRYFETVAKEQVVYPFGFGLSYTTFHVDTRDVSAADGTITVTAEVSNTGSYSGKEVVQVYFGAPQGRLGKPLRELIAYQKTDTLRPGESQTLHISFPVAAMASYDDSGITGHKSCYVLEAGDYGIYVGTDVRSAKIAYRYTIEELLVTQRLQEALAPIKDFERMHPVRQPDGSYQMEYEPVPKRTVDLLKRIRENRPQTLTQTGDKGIKLIDVQTGRHTMEDFVAQFSTADLAAIVLGEGMCSPKVTPGTGSAFGGVTDQLLHFGIPVCCTTDGPSGLRLDDGDKASSLPNGTLLACTWNSALIEELFVYEGVEMCSYHIDALLGPGINIHRHPLNGRNFEYLSEDPYLTGSIACAIVKGIGQSHATATIKHFIANNQEIGRGEADSVISERAIREIYLKAFEMCVKQGHATTIMTTYNPTNGFWNAGNYDLNTTILRGEWGYDGIVMTDWWAKINDAENMPGDTHKIKAMVRAQNDVYMVTDDAASYPNDIMEGLESDYITIGELQRCAMNLCRYIMRSPTFERYVANGCKVESQLRERMEQLHCFFELSDVQSGREYDFLLEETNTFVVAIEIVSDESRLSQMPVSVLVDHKNLAGMMVNGTVGAPVMHYGREVTVMKGAHKLRLEFSDSMLQVKSVQFLK